ncbi:MAG: YciI family protein [Gallionella sp.]|nr:YciI family protein [Gallionella sp.]
MLYSIVGKDVEDSLMRRMSVRPNHLARLHALQEQGRLLLAGPFPAIDAADPGAAGYTGSLIVAEFTTLQAAQEWADADPYVAAGVYAEVQVKPFRKVFPA